jgi:hypothetical protein
MEDIKNLQQARLTSSKEKKMNGWLFKVSNRKNKKYDVYDPKTGKYLVSFGDNRYEHFKDKIGFWSKKDHNDKTRQTSYKKRHGTNPKYGSAGYFSLKYLW